MKKILLLLSVFLFVISCDDSVPKESEGNLPGGGELVFDEGTDFNFKVLPSGCIDTINFIAKSAWEATVNDESKNWCSVSSTGGEKGAIVLSVIVKQNESTSEREATISIKSGESIQAFVLTQLEAKEDLNFKGYLLDNFDLDGDGKISDDEALLITDIDCSSMEIRSMYGINSFVNLKSIKCVDNRLTTLDVSECTLLEELNCAMNNLTSLDISGCPSLVELFCSNNQLTTLDVSVRPSLKVLNCGNNELVTLDLSGSSSLTVLEIWENKFTNIDVSGCLELVKLDCAMNQLTTLDVEECKLLERLDCADNQLVSLYASRCELLTVLDCENNNFVNLETYAFPILKTLLCDGNQLTTLDFSRNTLLSYLWCDDNQLTTLNLSKCENLSKLSCANNFLTSLDRIPSSELNCSNNQLTSLDVSSWNPSQFMRELFCSNNQLTTLDVSMCKNLRYFDCSPMDGEGLATVYLKEGLVIDKVHPNRSDENIPAKTKILFK